MIFCPPGLRTIINYRGSIAITKRWSFSKSTPADFMIELGKTQI